MRAASSFLPIFKPGRMAGSSSSWFCKKFRNRFCITMQYDPSLNFSELVRQQRRRVVAPVFVVVGILVSCLAGCTSSGDVNQRAPEGRGVLPPVARPSSPMPAAAPRFFFRAESTDLSSRVLFQTDETADFRATVNEYSLSPNKHALLATSKSDRVLEMWTDHGELKLGGRPQEWKQGQMMMVPAGASIELTNPTNRELVVRLYVAEAR